MQKLSPEEIAQQTKIGQEQLKAQANYKVSGAEVRASSKEAKPCSFVPLSASLCSCPVLSLFFSPPLCDLLSRSPSPAPLAPSHPTTWVPMPFPRSADDQE